MGGAVWLWVAALPDCSERAQRNIRWLEVWNFGRHRLCRLVSLGPDRRAADIPDSQERSRRLDSLSDRSLRTPGGFLVFRRHSDPALQRGMYQYRGGR